MEDRAIVPLSDFSLFVVKRTSAFRGEIDRDSVPKMATHSLIQSKDFTILNTQEATESIGSAASCVSITGERITFRLSFAERQALEIEAKRKNITLSKYIRNTLIPKNIAA